MIDAQFDFNLYDKAVGAIAFDDGSWDDLVATNESSIEAYGAHHLMGNITGNQDRPRFTSLADGTLDVNEDMKFQGWTRDIGHGGPDGYAKMRLLMSYIMSVPGIPCVYYGDEIADVGGNDPDNRRMMRFEGLNVDEVATRDWTAQWTHLRRGRLSMLYGTTTFHVLNDDVLHIEREHLGEVTHVLLNRSAQDVSIPSQLKQPEPPLAGFLTDEGLLPGWGAVAFGPKN
jgi:glycosidase